MQYRCEDTDKRNDYWFCELTGRMLIWSDTRKKYLKLVMIDNGVYVFRPIDGGKTIRIATPKTATIDTYDLYVCSLNLLDEKEKEYLRAVVKPFMKYHDLEIVKEKIMNDYAITIIIIDLRDYSSGEIKFPLYKDKTMYQGLEENKYYNLKELLCL